MKKLVSLVLALCMVLSLASFAAAEEYNMPAMNTTDPITLSVMVWDDFEMTEALAASFMEQYPNITVEIIRTTTANVTADLTNYAAFSFSKILHASFLLSFDISFGSGHQARI